mmetsp:Transcript_2907/g.7248  ORF Transcript_2907/g.7248 Transcript_2907/m.7248 type:complete len:274 (-) Transcript_2907:410-1231(-)
MYRFHPGCCVIAAPDTSIAPLCVIGSCGEAKGGLATAGGARGANERGGAAEAAAVEEAADRVGGVASPSSSLAAATGSYAAACATAEVCLVGLRGLRALPALPSAAVSSAGTASDAIDVEGVSRPAELTPELTERAEVVRVRCGWGRMPGGAVSEPLSEMPLVPRESIPLGPRVRPPGIIMLGLKEESSVARSSASPPPPLDGVDSPELPPGASILGENCAAKLAFIAAMAPPEGLTPSSGALLCGDASPAAAAASKAFAYAPRVGFCRSTGD